MAAAVLLTIRGIAVGHGGEHFVKLPDLVFKAGTPGLHAFEQRPDLAFHLLDPLLDQEAAVDDDAATVGDTGDREPGKAGLQLRFAAMDRIDVEGGRAGAFGHHRHLGLARVEQRVEMRLDLGQHRAHVPDRAVAQKRHAAMGDAPLGLDLGPPDAAVAQADPVLVERFGDDHVLDARRVEPAKLGQMRHPAITAGFLIRRRGYLDGPRNSGWTATKASAATIAVASPPFISQAPRP